MPHLLIFAKYPRSGEVKTRLSPPLAGEEAAILYRAFLLDALESYASLAPEVTPVLYLANGDDLEAMRELMREEGIGVMNDAMRDDVNDDAIGPRRVAMEVRAQRGSGLGERMEHAFEEAFAAGARAACAIGTDHPTLPIEYVRRAFAAIDDNDAVIGPADDGGYYLLALPRPAPELLRDMPYSTPDLYDATLRLAGEHRMRILQLPLWYDVDDAESLLKLWEHRAMLPAGSRTARVLERLAGRMESIRALHSSNRNAGD